MSRLTEWWWYLPPTWDGLNGTLGNTWTEAPEPWGPLWFWGSRNRTPIRRNYSNGRKTGACLLQQAAKSGKHAPQGEQEGKGFASSPLLRPLGTWSPLQRPELTVGKCGSTLGLHHEYARGNPEVWGHKGTRVWKGCGRWGRLPPRSHGLTVQLSNHVFCYLSRKAFALDLSKAKRTKGVTSPGALVCMSGNHQRLLDGW